MIEILYLIAVAISASLESYFDACKVLNGDKIRHDISAIVRVTIISSICFYFLEPYYAVIMSLMSLTVYWMVFDPMFNLLRHGKYMTWYIGTTAFTDKMARKYLGMDGRVFMDFKALFLFLLFFFYTINEY